MSLLPLLLNRNRSNRPTLNLEFTANPVPASVTFTRATTRTRINSAGALETVAINTPAIDYDPVTLACRGLSVWEARTNSVANAIASCVGSSTTASTGTATGPDGLAATKVVPNAGAVAFPGSGTIATQAVANAQTVGQSTDYAFSGYFSSFGPLNYQPYIVVMAGNAAMSTDQVYALVLFNPATGAFSAKTLNTGWTEVAAPTATLMPCGMWYVTWVVRYTQQALLRTGVSQYLQIWNEAGTHTYTATGTSGIQRAFNQFEVGSSVSPTIVTTTAQVTRAADVAVISGANFSNFYNQSEGTFVIAAELPSTSAYRVLAQSEDGANNNRVYLDVNSGAARLVSTVSGANQGLCTLDALTASTAFRVAAGYKLNDYAASLNGAAVVPDTTATVPTVDRLRIGTDQGNYVNGWIRSITYYPVKFANATYPTLST